MNDGIGRRLMEEWGARGSRLTGEMQRRKGPLGHAVPITYIYHVRRPLGKEGGRKPKGFIPSMYRKWEGIRASSLYESTKKKVFHYFSPLRMK